ncbi:hypothetical protein, partial [Joostella sp. CR20]|uniref:hypothetical protein n=1 Tax=Joostella sp. CR20 TaxID=2804312 RepID=UPI00313D4B84
MKYFIKKRIILFIMFLGALILNIECIRGQNGNINLNRVIPPSPEASSLGKFTEIPVSFYTGLPNINVPLWEFKVGNKIFPIRIDYHSRGIKVNEISSRVGTGWTLNAGGLISRQVRHISDDERPYGYLMKNNSLIPKLASGEWFSNLEARHDFIGQNVDILEGTDRVPDMFNLQVNELSAKFILDYNPPYKPIIQKFDDLKLLYSTDAEGRVTGFVLTDMEGYKYYFGVSKDGNRRSQDWEKSIGNYVFSYISGDYRLTSNPFYKTYNTWHLMDIESPFGDLASFVYEEEISTFFRRSYDIKEGNDVFNYTSKIESHQYQLKKIVYEGGRIEFNRVLNFEREDLKGSYALDNVSIYDGEYNFIKSFHFNYSYNIANENRNVLSILKDMEHEASKRLFLDSIIEKGEGEKFLPPYIFSYKEGELPNRFSNSQDYWGYYNGANNGPFLTFFDYGYHEIDRSVDTQKSGIGILNKITYPTGGTTKFIYDDNKGRLGYEYRNVLLPRINPRDDGDNPKTVFLGSLMYNDQMIYDGNTYKKTFEIGEGLVGHLDYNVWFQDIRKCQEMNVTTDCRFRVYLQGEGKTYDLLIGSGKIVNIPPGRYTLIVDPILSIHDPINNNNDHFTVNVNWTEEQLSGNVLYAGGKRIRRIEFMDENNALLNFKEYGYEYGEILSVASFYSYKEPSASNYITLEPLGAVPSSPLSTYQGNSIGYGRVTEYKGGKEMNIGKTVFDFTMQPDTGGHTSFPYHPPTDNQWLRGLLLTKKMYKKELNDNYNLVKQTDYFYSYGDFSSGNEGSIPLIFTPNSKRMDIDESLVYTSNIIDEGLPYDYTRTLYRIPFIQLYYPNSESVLSGDMKYKIYYFTGGTLKNTKVDETFYSKDGKSLMKEMQNNFNYNKHYQINSVFNQLSNGKTLTTKTFYPDDITSPSFLAGGNLTPVEYAAIDRLKAVRDNGTAGLHRISAPIQVETYKDN